MYKRQLDGFAHVALEFASVVHDIHGAAAEHIARTNHQRIADFVSQTNGLFFGTSSSVGRLMKTQVLQQMLEAFTVFSCVDRVRRRTDDVDTVGVQSTSEFERGLTAVLNDNAFEMCIRDSCISAKTLSRSSPATTKHS